jgi:hypothetical protein
MTLSQIHNDHREDRADLQRRRDLDIDFKRATMCGQSGGDDPPEAPAEDITMDEEGVNFGDVEHHHHYPPQQPVPMSRPTQASQPGRLAQAVIPFLLGAAISGPTAWMVGYIMNQPTTTVTTPKTDVGVITQPPAFGLDGAEIVSE